MKSSARSLIEALGLNQMDEELDWSNLIGVSEALEIYSSELDKADILALLFAMDEAAGKGWKDIYVHFSGNSWGCNWWIAGYREKNEQDLKEEAENKAIEKRWRRQQYETLKKEFEGENEEQTKC